jgi:hypothetical protein
MAGEERMERRCDEGEIIDEGKIVTEKSSCPHRHYMLGRATLKRPGPTDPEQ